MRKPASGPRKILHFSAFLNYAHGGAELVVRQLIDALNGRFFDGTAHYTVGLDGGEQDMPPHFYIPVSGQFREGRRLCQLYKRLLLFFPSERRDRALVWKLQEALCDIERYSAFHVHDQHWLRAVSILAAIYQKPLIVTSHELLPRVFFPGQTNRALERLIQWSLKRHAERLVPTLAMAAAVTAPSKFAAGTIGRFLEARRFAPASKVRAIYNWVPDDQAAAAELPVLSRPYDQRILYVGRLAKEKGLDVLLRAWDRPFASLAVAGGGGPLLGEVKAAAARHPRVRWLGAVKSEHIVHVMREYDLVVIPSRVDETFCKTALEARIAGVKIVATTAGAIPEVLDGCRNALLVPHYLNEEKLLGHLTRGIGEMLGRGRIEESAAERECWLQKFRECSSVRRYQELYR
jgi:glycosyltransferase involved in cell wall biosynthesis